MKTWSEGDWKQLVPDYQNKIVVLVFTEHNCPHCQNFLRSYEQIKNSLDLLDIEFIQVDLDASPNAAQLYGLTGAPTFLFLIEGQPHSRITGFHTADEFCSKVRASFLINC